MASERNSNALEGTVIQMFDRVWADTAVVQLLEYNQLVAQDARALLRRAMTLGAGLKPADAIHLASAARLACHAFHTYEAHKLTRYGSWINCPIVQPHVTQPPLPFSSPQE